MVEIFSSTEHQRFNANPFPSQIVIISEVNIYRDDGYAFVICFKYSKKKNISMVLLKNVW